MVAIIYMFVGWHIFEWRKEIILKSLPYFHWKRCPVIRWEEQAVLSVEQFITKVSNRYMIRVQEERPCGCSVLWYSDLMCSEYWLDWKTLRLGNAILQDLIDVPHSSITCLYHDQNWSTRAKHISLWFIDTDTGNKILLQWQVVQSQEKSDIAYGIYSANTSFDLEQGSITILVFITVVLRPLPMFRH